MSNQFQVKVDGDAKLVTMFSRAAANARPRLKRALQFLGIGLVAHIQKTKLRGQRLNQRTGRLSASVHEETVESAAGITTHVGTNVKYARPHEYGFQGPVQYKAHIRTIKQAFGRPIAPTVTHVRARVVKMNIGEKRMFRDSLAEFQPKIAATMKKLSIDIAKEAVGK